MRNQQMRTPHPLIIDAFLVRAAHDATTHNDKSLRARSSIGTWFKISTDGQGHRDTLQFEVTAPPPRTEPTSSPSSAGQTPISSVLIPREHVLSKFHQ